MPVRAASQMNVHAAIHLPHFEPAIPRSVGEDLARSQLRRAIVMACDYLSRCDLGFRIEEKASVEAQSSHCDLLTNIERRFPQSYRRRTITGGDVCLAWELTP
jgi:hypothetical protein